MSETLDRIYRAHVGAVYRFALSCVGQREIAEEITSDTFVALVKHSDALDEASLQGWLITVARNRARDYWRQQMAERRMRSALDPAPLVPPVEGGDVLMHRTALKPVHRTCIHLRYVEGMTRSEIADVTGLSDTQVKGYLQYALQLLRASAGARA